MSYEKDLEKMYQYYQKGSSPSRLASSVKDYDKAYNRFIIATGLAWDEAAEAFKNRHGVSMYAFVPENTLEKLVDELEEAGFQVKYERTAFPENHIGYISCYEPCAFSYYKFELTYNNEKTEFGFYISKFNGGEYKISPDFNNRMSLELTIDYIKEKVDYWDRDSIFPPEIEYNGRKFIKCFDNVYSSKSQRVLYAAKDPVEREIKTGLDIVSEGFRPKPSQINRLWSTTPRTRYLNESYGSDMPEWVFTNYCIEYYAPSGDHLCTDYDRNIRNETIREDLTIRQAEAEAWVRPFLYSEKATSIESLYE